MLRLFAPSCYREVAALHSALIREVAALHSALIREVTPLHNALILQASLHLYHSDEILCKGCVEASAKTPHDDWLDLPPCLHCRLCTRM